MTRRRLLIATAAVAASVGIAACDGQDRSSPMGPSTSASSAASLSRSPSATSRQSNVLRVTKDCTLYTGRAGDTCTVTSSTFNAIKPGSTITYASGAAANGFLDTDIVIDPPGRSGHMAFGHCSLDLVTGDGRCTLSGGTGKFEDVSASVVVSHLGGPNYGWEGTYSVGSKPD